MIIGICDDQEVYLEDVVKHCWQVFDKDTVTTCFFHSGEEFLRSNQHCDFLFLDIEMDRLDGIQVKDTLESQGTQTKIIFLTSHEERMIEAFGTNVIGFLKKPIQQDAFIGIAQKMKSLCRKKTIEWEEAGKYRIIEIESIRYIEAQNKYTKVVAKEQEYLVRRTITEWEALLPKSDFVRINRFYLVHFELFDKTKDTVTLETGKTTLISRKNKAMILEQYKVYLRKKAEALW